MEAIKLIFSSRIFAISENLKEISIVVITTFGFINSIREIKKKLHLVYKKKNLAQYKKVWGKEKYNMPAMPIGFGAYQTSVIYKKSILKTRINMCLII